MNRQDWLNDLRKVAQGSLSPEEMLAKIKQAPFEDIGIANIDYHRSVRQGAGEVIYGKSKTPDQIFRICEAMLKHGEENILITRMHSEAAKLLHENNVELFYDRVSQIGIVKRRPKPLRGCVVVASAGTSDLPVCEEAALTCENYGSRVERLYDVGVSGIHRLLSRMDVLSRARVVVAVAGMEGALASVIGGLVDCPVIAVPTSVGYGASFQGVAALLSMLNSCASGLSVVNIDNGFGAGYLANMINQMESIRE